MKFWKQWQFLCLDKKLLINVMAANIQQQLFKWKHVVNDCPVLCEVQDKFHPNQVKN